MKNTIILFIFIALICMNFNAFAIDARERRDFQKIEELFLKEDFEAVKSRCGRFLGDYRDSRFRKRARHLKEIAKEKLEYKGEKNVLSEYREGKEVFYIIQVGAFKKLDNANKLKRRLKRQGFESVILKVRANGRIFYRVRAGKFRSLENAERLVRNLKRKGYTAEIINEE